MSYVIQVDLAKSANIVSWESWLGHGDANATKLHVLDEIVLQEIEGQWLPISYAYKDLHYNPDTGTSLPRTAVRTSFAWERINEPVSDADFVLDFPAGTRVIDDIRGVAYRSSGTLRKAFER
jgi:hypothetical protein